VLLGSKLLFALAVVHVPSFGPISWCWRRADFVPGNGWRAF
jgi:hypothetical protein